MSATKRLIVSADDFGLCGEVDRGILDCCASGAVSSVSVVSAGASFRSDNTKLRAFPGTGIGAHLCLNDELPLSPPGEIPSLVSGGRLLPYRDMALRLLSGRIEPGEVYLEWKRQIEALLAAGLSPDHLDTHNHVHLYPALFRVLVHLAEEYGINAIRLPGRYGAAESGLNAAGAAKFLLSRGTAAKERELSLRGIARPETVLGFFGPSALTRERLLGWAAKAGTDGITELITHPGLGHSREHPGYAAWNYDWQGARDALIGFAAEGGWQKAGARLCTYSDLAPSGDTERPGGGIAGISVVIPAMNERENICKTLSVTRRYLRDNASDCEIIVVDDMSTDGTGEAAAELLRGTEGRVLRTGKRAGYGAALRTGFDAARKEWILYFDADYPARVDNIGRAFACAGGSDLVVGKRSREWGEGPLRLVYRYGYGTLVRWVFGLRVADVNFAFKLFRARDWRRLNVTSNGGFIDAELLLQAGRAGLSVREIPMDLLTRTFGSSSLANWRNIADILTEAARRLR